MTPEQQAKFEEKAEMKKLRKRLEEKSKTIAALEKEVFQLKEERQNILTAAALVETQRNELSAELAGLRVTKWVTSGDLKLLKDDALDSLFKEVSELKAQRSK